MAVVNTKSARCGLRPVSRASTKYQEHQQTGQGFKKKKPHSVGAVAVIASKFTCIFMVKKKGVTKKTPISVGGVAVPVGNIEGLVYVMVVPEAGRVECCGFD